MTTTVIASPVQARPRCVPATLVGGRAAACLRAEAHGKVMAVVSQAAYLCTEDGTILWLSPPGSVVHPRALLAPVFTGGITPGLGFSVRDGELHIGEWVRIQLDGAPVWSTPLIARVPDFVAGELFERVCRLAAEVAPAAPPWGLGFSLAMLAGGRPQAEPADAASLSLRQLARPALARFLPATDDALWDSLEERVERLADDLLGLGPGLTPSGDDFVGGVLFALHLAQVIDPHLAATCDRLDRSVVSAARSRTNAISASFLADYATGDGPQPLVDLGIRLIAADEPGARRAAEELVRIGSLTGWDTLAGTLLGLIAASREVVRGIAISQSEKEGTNGHQRED